MYVHQFYASYIMCICIYVYAYACFVSILYIHTYICLSFKLCFKFQVENYFFNKLLFYIIVRKNHGLPLILNKPQSTMFSCQILSLFYSIKCYDVTSKCMIFFSSNTSFSFYSRKCRGFFDRKLNNLLLILNSSFRFWLTEQDSSNIQRRRYKKQEKETK